MTQPKIMVAPGADITRSDCLRYCYCPRCSVLRTPARERTVFDIELLLLDTYCDCILCTEAMSDARPA